MSNSSPLNKDHWLRRLEWSLHSLPSKDRTDIVLEARSHIEDRIAQGVSETDALSSLGTPEEHAHGFVQEFELSEALGSRAGFRMLRVAGNRVHRNAAAALAMLLVFMLGVIAIGTVLTALMRFTNGAQWGVWTASHMFLIGYQESNDGAREIVGAGIYPLAVLCVFTCWHMGRAILLWALRTMAKR